MMSYPEHMILRYLNDVDERLNIKPMLMGVSFWRGCFISNLIQKYKLTILEAYDILFKFTGQKYYEPGNWLLKIGNNGYANDDITKTKDWNFTTKDKAFGYKTEELAHQAMKTLDPLNFTLAKVELK